MWGIDMSKVYLEDSILTGIGNAIRSKTGDSGLITPANMATAIGNISGSGDNLTLPAPVIINRVNDYFVKGAESVAKFCIPTDFFQGKNQIKIIYTLIVPRIYQAYRRFSISLESSTDASWLSTDDVVTIVSDLAISSSLIKQEYIYTIDGTMDYSYGLLLKTQIVTDNNCSEARMHNIRIDSVEVS